jgi:S1-C subfamily serine protease
VNDIIKYGTVQRAFLGISYPREGLTEEQKNEEGIKDIANGIYVMDVPAGGAAAEAGIKKGDIITSINGITVTTGPEMVEQIARYKPGDNIILGYIRKGEQKTVSVSLKKKAGSTNVAKATNILDRLGADLANIDKKPAAANNLNGGVFVKKIQPGSAIQKSRIQEGFIITAVNGIEVSTIDDLKAALSNSSNSGTVRIDGIYPGYGDTYSYPGSIDGGE